MFAESRIGAGRSSGRSAWFSERPRGGEKTLLDWKRKQWRAAGVECRASGVEQSLSLSWLYVYTSISPKKFPSSTATTPRVLRCEIFFNDMSDWDTAPITLRKRAPKSSTLKTEKVTHLVNVRGLLRICAARLYNWLCLFTGGERRTATGFPSGDTSEMWVARVYLPGISFTFSPRDLSRHTSYNVFAVSSGQSCVLSYLRT